MPSTPYNVILHKRNSNTTGTDEDYDTLYPTTLLANVTGLQTALDAKESLANKGVANGYAPLDATGKLSTAYLSDEIIGGINRIGAIVFTTGTTSYDIDDLITAYPAMAHGTATTGDYWYVSYTDDSVTLTITEDAGENNDRFFNRESGAYDSLSVSLAAGDWIIFDGYDIGGWYKWTVVNHSFAGHTHNSTDIYDASGVNYVSYFNGSGLLTHSGITVTKLGYLTDVTGNIQAQINAKAPTSHRATDSTYGLGDTTYYGHVKLINNLLASSYTDGCALSAYQGYRLAEKIGQHVTIASSRPGLTEQFSGDVWVELL